MPVVPGARPYAGHLTTTQKIAYYRKKEEQANIPRSRSPPRAIMASTSTLSGIAADPRFGGYGHNKVDKRKRGGKGGVKKVVKRARKSKAGEGKVAKSEEFIKDEDGEDDVMEELEGGEGMDVDAEDESMDDVEDVAGDEEGNDGDDEGNKTKDIGGKKDRGPIKRRSKSTLLSGNEFSELNYTTSKPIKKTTIMAPSKVSKAKTPKMKSYDPPGEKNDLKPMTKKQRDAHWKKMLEEDKKRQTAQQPKTPRKPRKKVVERVFDSDEEEEGEEPVGKIKETSPPSRKRGKPIEKAKMDMSDLFGGEQPLGKMIKKAPVGEGVLVRKTAKAEKAAIQHRRDVMQAGDVQAYMKNTFYREVKDSLNKFKGDVEKMSKNAVGKRRFQVIKSQYFKDVIQKLIDCGDYNAPSLKSPIKVYEVMKLDEKVRREVWERAVVDQKFFIYPDTKLGAEQPDLAMVNKEIRKEVLPIYYGKNIFAVELMGDNIENESGLKSVKKFADALTPAGWFDHINHWVFSCTSLQTDAAFDADDDSVMVSLKIEKHNKSWNASLQVHKDVTCFKKILPGIRKCVPAVIPGWMIDLAKTFTNEANKLDRVTGEMIVGLGAEIRARADELPELWCT